MKTPKRNNLSDRQIIDCAGKVAFDDHDIAVKAAGRRPGRQVYRCRHCRKWHVGNRGGRLPSSRR